MEIKIKTAKLSRRHSARLSTHKLFVELQLLLNIQFNVKGHYIFETVNNAR